MFSFGKKNKTSQTKILAANLHDEKQKFELIVNAIEDGVVLIDSEKVVRLFNPGAGNISGWDIDEANGLTITAVLKLVDAKNQPYEDDVNPFLGVFAQGQNIRDNSAILITKSGKQIPISLNVSPLWDANKQVTGAVAVFRDVAEERAEEQRRADFISTASHEMRTPVAAIEGYLALALNAKVTTIDNRARDYLEKAHSSTQHLGQLFQDLLTSAKAEDGRLTSHPVVVEMGAFLEQLSNDLKFAAEKKGLFTEFILGSSKTIDASGGAGGERVVRPLYYVFVDPDRLREVITNLFDNAVKYTPEGKVSLGLTGDPQVVQMYVRDTGPGIPGEDLAHLFQKFYRVDNSATRTIGGTGLGLFICRKIVELYGGRIWVESELDKGSSFFINFPRLSTEQAAQKQALEAQSTELKPIDSLAAAGTP
ncbi:MAG: ATP-binding protein [Patescibacteria group bacterium]|nr:ATP-binding protein [Patescibacteria group bacterium]